MERLRKTEGFTLIELLVVVAIIAILAAIAIPQYMKYKRTAAVNATRQSIATGITSLAAAYVDSGTTDWVVDVSNGNEVSLTYVSDVISFKNSSGATDVTNITNSGYDIGCTLLFGNENVRVSCY